MTFSSRSFFFHSSSHASTSRLNLLHDASLALLVRNLLHTLVGMGFLSFRVNHRNDVSTPLVSDVSLRLLLILRVFADLGVALLVHVLDAISLNIVLNELGELNFVTLRIFLFEHLHVFLKVRSQDSFQMRGSVILVVHSTLFRFSVTWELFHVVRNVKTTVNGSLKDSEDASTRHAAGQTQVEEHLEGALFV